MQTFLPYPDFHDSAYVLDNRRLGKQRVEAKQILLALGVDVGLHRGNRLSRWRNHPAVKMWKGAESGLCVYAISICDEWRCRGFNDSLKEQFVDAYFVVRDTSSKRPPWLGDGRIHASHRSNLLRKNPDHYGQFGWDEPSSIQYHWPVGTSASEFALA